MFNNVQQKMTSVKQDSENMEILLSMKYYINYLVAYVQNKEQMRYPEWYQCTDKEKSSLGHSFFTVY